MINTFRKINFIRDGLISIVAATLFFSCTAAPWIERTEVDPKKFMTLDRDSPYLKAHLKNGGVYVLSHWAFFNPDSTHPAAHFTGRGVYYNVLRDSTPSPRAEVSVDSVALLETNVEVAAVPIAFSALTILSVAEFAAAIGCIANPKSCFGSCPTFYASDGTRQVLQAEGFSASVLPCLEQSDVDALYRVQIDRREFDLLMTNEAMETHVVRHADILAVPRDAGTRVFATSANEFFEAENLYTPLRAMCDEGDCADKLRAFDGDERFSEADSTDLGAMETIDCVFPASAGKNFGVVIAARQSLMSTFLFYQGLSYLGTHAGESLAAMERTRTVPPIYQYMPAIECMVQDSNGAWITAGKVDEVGPIATDVHLIRLPICDASHPVVRLRLPRGGWRIDWVALAALGVQRTPVRIHPEKIFRRDTLDETARDELLDSARALVTLPGDRYTLRFQLPEKPQAYELFLESRGYYLEWMRPDWIAGENLWEAAQMMADPRGALRRLARTYKKIEPAMEAQFWNSRYAHQ